LLSCQKNIFIEQAWGREWHRANVLCIGEQAGMCVCGEGKISRAGIVVNVFIRKIWETVGVRKRTDLHVDAAFGYVNFVERVGEGGIETIEYSEFEICEDKIRRSSFIVPKCNSSDIRIYQFLQKKQSWGWSAKR